MVHMMRRMPKFSEHKGFEHHHEDMKDRDMQTIRREREHSNRGHMQYHADGQTVDEFPARGGYVVTDKNGKETFVTYAEFRAYDHMMSKKRHHHEREEYRV